MGWDSTRDCVLVSRRRLPYTQPTGTGVAQTTPIHALTHFTVSSRYRVNPPSVRSKRWGNTFQRGHRDLRERIQTKYSGFVDGTLAFPTSEAIPSIPLESTYAPIPFTNLLPQTASRGSIMLVVPWFAMGGADLGAVRTVETLAREGYRVTVVCTLYDPPTSIELLPQVKQWTHDVHVLPSFLRAADFPNYLVYLARSRGIHTLLFSNSMLLYEMLPGLRDSLPGVAFVDYLHNESEEWKAGGYPRYSIINQRHLDHTVTCSQYLKDWLVERGHTEERIGVVKLGLELDTVKPVESSTLRRLLQEKLYGLPEDTTFLLSVARVDKQKRPLIVPEIVDRLVKTHGYSCTQRGVSGAKPIRMVMVGAGPLESQLEQKIISLGLSSCFILAGSQDDPMPFYQTADLFLLPSELEGVSVAVSEAMAFGLPIVTTRAGALPEQVGTAEDTTAAGITVSNSKAGKELPSAADYAKAVHRILSDEAVRRRYSRNGVQRTQGMHWRSTLKGLVSQLDVAHRSLDHPRTPSELSRLPNPSFEMAIQTQLHEYRSAVDFASHQASLNRVKKRTTRFGALLQKRCTETPELSEWFDALENPVGCPGSPTLDVVNLQKSALSQCGRCEWMDLPVWQQPERHLDLFLVTPELSPRCRY